MDHRGKCIKGKYGIWADIVQHVQIGRLKEINHMSLCVQMLFKGYRHLTYIWSHFCLTNALISLVYNSISCEITKDNTDHSRLGIDWYIVLMVSRLLSPRE